MATASESVVVGTLAAAQSNMSINLYLVNMSQDWKNRQKICYEAIKGYLITDFHSLNDFSEQMGIVMKGAPPTMKITWAIASKLVPLQRRLRLSTMISPTLGRIGTYLMTLVGFSSTYRAPTEILSKTSSLGGFF